MSFEIRRVISEWEPLHDIIHLRDRAMQVYRLKNKDIGPVHTKTFSKECVFLVIEKSRSIRVHITVFMYFRLFTLGTFKNYRIARCGVS